MLPNLASFLLKEDIIDILKGNGVEEPMTHASQNLQVLNNIQAVIQMLYDRLEQARLQTAIIDQVRTEVEQKTGKRIQTDELIGLAMKLPDKVKAASDEYSQARAFMSPDEPAIHESLTLATAASFAMTAAKSMGTMLKHLAKAMENCQAQKLIQALTDAARVMERIEGTDSAPSLPDDQSFALYKALWDKGFHASKTFLPTDEYKANKENSRLLSEGVFYKMSLSLHAFGAVQGMLSLCSAYLKSHESAHWLSGLSAQLNPRAMT